MIVILILAHSQENYIICILLVLSAIKFQSNQIKDKFSIYTVFLVCQKLMMLSVLYKLMVFKLMFAGETLLTRDEILLIYCKSFQKLNPRFYSTFNLLTIYQTCKLNTYTNLFKKYKKAMHN